MRGLFITGTDTGVGKTWIGCQLARQLTEQGVRVVPRKPVESGCTPEDDQLIPEDALALLKAADYSGSLDEVCRWRFEAAISPQRAAKLLDQPLTTAQLADACRRQLDSEDFLLVEGAGGFYSPLCADGLNADLAQALGLPLLLVAEDRLGCINQVLLTAEAIATRGLSLRGVILNRIQPAPAGDDMDNRDDLQQRLDCPVIPMDSLQQDLPAGLISRLLARP